MPKEEKYSWKNNESRHVDTRKYDSSDQKQDQADHQNLNSVKKIHFFSNAKLMSPLEKGIVQFKDFSTPIQIAQFSQNKKCRFQEQNDQSSPLMLIQLTADIKKIAQKQNQDSEDGDMDYYQQSHEIQVQTVMDVMGNKICQFNVGTGNYTGDEDDRQLSPIAQDKQNDLPQKFQNLNTPLKVRQHQARSPLQDITPSMTHKKRQNPFNTKTNKKNRTSNKSSNGLGIGFELQKWGLLTPRTMAESRLNKNKGSGLQNSKLKIERF